MLPVIVGNLIPIITLPLFTRQLSTDEYGIFSLSQVYAIFINGIANFGLIAGFERNYFESNEIVKRTALLYSILSFVVIVSLLFTSITALVEGFLLKNLFHIRGYENLLILAYGATAISGFKVYFLSYFKNAEEAKSYVFYSIDETVLTTVFSLLFVFIFRLQVYGLILGQLVSATFVLTLLLIRFTKKHSITFDFNALKSTLKLSLPLTPKIFFGVLNSQLDKYLIGLLSSIGGVGIYNIAQKIANVTFTFMTAIQNVFSPQVYSRMFDMEEKSAGKSIGTYLTPFYYVSIFVGMLVALFSEEIIIILFPTDYHDAINITSIFSILYSSYFFSKHPQLIYSKKTWLSSVLFVFSIILNIVIGIPFAKIWGPIGVAWGSLLSGIIWGAVYFYVSQKSFYIEWESDKILAITLIFIVSSMTLILMRHFQTSYVLRFVVKLVSVGLFIERGVAYRIISKNTFSSLKSMLNKSK
ncbi:MAG: oligosaccharide flippase family protein [Chitinophagaceae bacterium]|nr:oligosaccharide flippase family protein [Chitinophagaceae bacterium]